MVCLLLFQRATYVHLNLYGEISESLTLSLSIYKDRFVLHVGMLQIIARLHS